MKNEEDFDVGSALEEMYAELSAIQCVNTGYPALWRCRSRTITRWQGHPMRVHSSEPQLNAAVQSCLTQYRQLLAEGWEPHPQFP